MSKRILIDCTDYFLSNKNSGIQRVAKNILGNSNKAVELLGWKRKVSFNKLVDKMMNEDLAKFNLI